MLAICFVDDSGHTIVSGPQTVAGHFLAAPLPVVETDANGYASGVFTREPIAVKQTDENGFNGGVFYSHPIAVVQTNATGTSTGSGKFLAAPISIVLI